MSRKELARMMIRHRVAPRRTPRPPQQRETPPPLVKPVHPITKKEEPPNKNSVYSIPDSWQTHARDLSPAVNAEPAEPAATPGPKKKAKHKRRGNSLNVCVSDEEAYLIKQFARDQGLSLSEWARRVMFAAMKTDIPNRS